jgi:hypothetical protein
MIVIFLPDARWGREGAEIFDVGPRLRRSGGKRGEAVQNYQECHENDVSAPANRVLLLHDIRGSHSRRRHSLWR